MRKRILALFLGILIILSSVPAVFAAGTPELTIGDYKAAAGETVAVDINVSGNPGICAMNFGVKYDAEKLTLISVSNGTIFSDFSVDPLLDKNPVIIQYLENGDVEEDGKLVTLVFKVLDTLEARDSTEISIQSATVINFDEQSVEFTLSSGKITVAEKTQTLKDFDDIFEFENTSVVYNGSKRSPGIKVKEGYNTDANWSVMDYSIQPRNVGTYDIKATVWANGYNEKTVTGTFTITPKEAEIVIKDVQAYVGDGYQLEYTVDGLVGTDSAAGTPIVVTDGSAGEYNITQGSLRIIDGESGKTSQNYTLTVKAGVLTLNNVVEESILLNTATVELKEGETFQLAAIFTPADTTIKDIEWTVKNSENANVTVVNGLVSAKNLASGYSASATVTATSANGKTATCTVTVVCSHQLELVNAVKATCSEKGNIMYYSCPDCGKLYADEYAEDEITADSTEIAINPDNHAYGTTTVGAKAPTESAEGYTGDVKCEKCEVTIKTGTTIPKLAHTNHIMTRHEGAAATCTAEGNAEYWTCSAADCRGVYYGNENGSAVLASVVIPKDPDKHSGVIIEDVNKKTKTCTENGYSGDDVYSCCGVVETYGAKIDATGHAVGDVWIIDEDSHYKVCSNCYSEVMKAEHAGNAATCTEASYCVVCNYQIAAANGHRISPAVEESNATCTEAGTMKHWKCSVCSNLFADQLGKTPATEEGVRIAPKGHKWKEWGKKDNSDKVTRYCTECEASESRTVVSADSGGMNFDLYKNDSDQTAEIEVKVNAESLKSNNGAVTINASGITNDGNTLEVKQVSIPSTAVNSVAGETNALAVTLTTGSVSFDADALTAINDQQGTKNTGSISLRVEPVGGDGSDVVSNLKDGMNNDQVNTVNDKLGGREVLGAVDLSLDFVGANQNTSLGSSEQGGFGDGSVTVTIPFTPSGTAKENYKMLYIAEDGTAEEVDATYADGYLTFEVKHFSQFIAVDPVAQFGNTTKALLSNAVADCAEGGTIELLGNVNEEVTISRALTIVKNGFTADNIKAGEGFVLSKEADKYVISKAAASIENHYFASLSEAIANAANGKTIELYASYDGNEIVVGKPVTIMLGTGMTANVKEDADRGIVMEYDEVNNVYSFIKAQAMIEGTEKVLYKTITEAIAEAGDKTVKLLSDLDSITFNAPATIELNGHTIKKITDGSSDPANFISLADKKIEKVYFSHVEKYGVITSVLLGDANADNVLADADITLLKNYFAGKATAEDAVKIDENTAQIDVDGDNEPTRRDLMILSRYLNGWKGYEVLPYKTEAAE